ncbi:lipoprotein insertase outer membrane protein LolB [Halothiobacillus neapolitanus]|uniref:Outer-membrane lipoprotein LolB n=1 Tax=Halothiobacillus neapolitanus (strain ATCC 23641 / DSM 15147 / CIP 104769 / NCIMB 8539 / c2) TaxID=555778 RepID=D0KZX9_HALNC|nr:lipoprotein insertase outer membrane protein LolB [Halothiobacillus neapolitanus]ACX96002.1 outer membrane lipoprotein LolB [Halothiobacillus neapolitanus c2]TDN66310.1 outer membrane lipoprotein LolB [Halothiobacillus neapolitanus]
MMNRFSFRSRLFAVGIALTTLLGGCAQQPIHLDQTESIQNRLNPTWKKHEQAVRQIADWQCIGRIAIRTETEGGTVNLNWHQIGDTAKIVLNAPLNQGTVELAGRPDMMLITDSSGHRQLTSNPEASIEQLTGWKIPITALPDWIRGLPHDKSALIQLNQNGQLRTLNDDGWLIDYESYMPVPGFDLEMPRKITVTRDDIRLRLVVESWQMKVNGKIEPSR